MSKRSASPTRTVAASAAPAAVRAGRPKTVGSEDQKARGPEGQKVGVSGEAGSLVPSPSLATPKRSGEGGSSATGSPALRLSGSPPASDAFRLVKDLGRDPEIVAFERQVVDFFIEMSDILGAPKSLAAIYGMIFATPEPLGFLELQQRLDISAGSISQGLRALKAVGAIKPATSEACIVSPKKRTETGNGIKTAEKRRTSLRSFGPTLYATRSSAVSSARREFYIPNLEARKLIALWLDQKLKAQLQAGQYKITDMAATLPDARRGSIVAKRITQLGNWHAKASALLPIVKAFFGMSYCE